MIRIRKALISVSDKRGIREFGLSLQKMGIEVISTGGTAQALRQAGIKVKDVFEVTGFPEMLDGRVKTLHPRIHGGILARRDKEDHLQALKDHGISLIDMVVVNLYPFEATVSREGVSFEDVIENIDIGGPTLIRAAAKNHQHVVVIVDPDDYDPVIRELMDNRGLISIKTAFLLACKAFERTSCYDRAIWEYLRSQRDWG